MNVDDFDKIVERRIELIRKSLVVKGREYMRGGDRLSNFVNGGRLLRCTPERALLGYLAKQAVSVVDFVHDVEQGVVRSQAEWDEKIGDCVNYLILLEAVSAERRASCGSTTGS